MSKQKNTACRSDTSLFCKLWEYKIETTWLNCVAWRQLAEVLNTHLHKGDQIFVQGGIEFREYTTKDGRNGTSIDLTVEKFSFVGSKKATNEPGAGDAVDPLGDHPF